MAKLRERMTELCAAILAANTRETYKSSWGIFRKWCEAAGRPALPASIETVALFLTHEINRGAKVTTAEHRLSAIVHYHRVNKLPVPLAPELRHLLSGAQREKKEQPDAKDALTVPQLRRIASRLNGCKPKDIRDRALILFGFASSLRRSEISALTMEDVSFSRAGMRVFIGSSKTDQQAHGRSIGIRHAADPLLCPVTAAHAWLHIRGDRKGAFFCRVNSGGTITGQAIAGDSICRIVQQAAQRAGIDPARIGAHSLRAGFVTASLAAGHSAPAVMERTGHRSVATVQRYYRPDVFAQNPLGGVI